MAFLPILHRVAARENLPAADSEQAMAMILRGEVSTPRIAAFLAALKVKGETAEEVLGFARAMRAAAVPVHAGCDGPLLDTCGTGGDGLSSFNISTIAALVAAGAGVRVAKHGNRSISSRCGSADLLEGLGVRIGIEPEKAGRAIREIGIGFLFAPSIHPAMKHAQEARIELKMRTVFNLLGPLTNPARATTQLAGAPSLGAADLMAEVLAALGLERGFVVHGSDGMDEITLSGETAVLEILHGAIAHRTVTPEDFGVSPASLDELHGGDLQTNCEIARAVLAGCQGPHRDIVLVNASAAIVAAGRANSFLEGVALAARSIDSGAAKAKAEDLARFTHAA